MLDGFVSSLRATILKHPLSSYPTLRAEDLTNAWAYARVHQDEIEQQILENETA